MDFELEEGDIMSPEVESQYSELVEAAQEYDNATDQYESAAINYNETFKQFKEGAASPEEMKEAMKQFAYADDELMNAGLELEGTASNIQLELGIKMEGADVVKTATEHTLAKEKIEETTENLSSQDYDFIESLQNLESITDGNMDTTIELMERDEEYLSEHLNYSWDDAMDEATDDSISAELEQTMENTILQAKRQEIIENSPNDRYIGGTKSETGTEDLEEQRIEVLGSLDLREKREEVLDSNQEDLEEARDKVKDRDPRYIH